MHPLRATAFALALGLALAACSAAGTTNTPGATVAPSAATGGDRYGSPSAAPSEAASEAPSEAPSAAPASGGASVELTTTPLGEILADGTGRTLYAFTPDTGGTPTCYGSCAQTWPPLTSAGAPSVGTGLDGAMFGSATRTDGGSQVTFHGMPLYYFGGDAAPGQTNGQGIGGKWYVVDKDGNLVK